MNWYTNFGLNLYLCPENNRMRTKKKTTKKNLRVWLVGATLSEYPPMRSLEKKNRILALALTTKTNTNNKIINNK
jgi:hypothetical protein